MSEPPIRMPSDGEPKPQHAIPSQESPAAEEVSRSAEQSRGQILKSSAMIGGSTLINILVGIVRTKAMAVLLGPSGIGLLGLYGAIADVAKGIAGMGVGSSGVRQMAKAASTGDTEQVARTATALRRVSVVLGVIGAALMILLSEQLSLLTFASSDRQHSIALLALVVFFACLSGGQGALIHGMRRISDLAKMGIIGALLGTAASIPIVYFFKESGLVPSLVAVAALATATSWWFARKVALPRSSMTLRDSWREASALLRLGVAFMASTLMMAGAAYAIRLILLRTSGVEAAGLYQSAWTLGGLYVGFILQAMGTDFYPRLTGVAGDDAACNRMVNEQAQVSLLLAGPGVMATLTLAPLVLSLFYSAKFQGAVDMLRWICLGMALRVISWPIGFVIVAKGVQGTFFLVELAWTAVYLILAWICVGVFGAEGAGIAFFASYVFHAVMIYAVVHRLSGFRWLAVNTRTIAGFLGATGVVFCGFRLLPPLPGTALGILAVLLSCAYSVRTLVDLVSPEQIPRPILKLLVWFRLAPQPRSPSDHTESPRRAAESGISRRNP